MADIARIADVYVEVLSNRMGLEVTVKDDLLLFSPGGELTVALPLLEHDPEFAHFSAPFAAISSEVPLLQLYEICTKVTRRTGVATTIDPDRNLEFSVSWPVAGADCLPSAEHLQHVLPRGLAMLTAAIGLTLTEIQFADLVHGEREES